MTNSIIFIMGVSGSGKSTIGELLAKELMLPLFDADDFHPTSNVAKMQNGIPLNDQDRIPWLDNLNALAKEKLNTTGAIIPCSALKAAYRERLARDLNPSPIWVFLNGNTETILARLKLRKGHFMPPSLLASQFDTLEIPTNAIEVDISQSPSIMVAQILAAIHQLK